MPDDPSCQAPQAPTGAVPRTCVPFAHVPAVPVVAVPYVPVPVPSGLPVLSVAGILPDRTGNVDVTRFLEEWAAGPLADKADKASPAVAGSLASLDASGNLVDSGATPASIKAAAVAAVVNGADATMDTLKEIADILGSNQASGSVLKRILDLESGKVNKEAGKGLVAVDAALATSGAAADAKAVGDVLRGGFTEWEFSGNSLPGVTYTVDITEYEGPVYIASLVGSDGTAETDGVDSLDVESVSFTISGITATRRLITPTKTSQLTNDGAPNGGGTPYATTEQIPDVSGKMDGAASYPPWDASVAAYPEGYVVSWNGRLWRAKDDILDLVGRPDGDGAAYWEETTISELKQDALSAAQLANIAAVPDKANTSALPYRLVEPGKWEFSGSGVESGVTYTVEKDDSSSVAPTYWVYLLKANENIIEGASVEDENPLSIVFEQSSITATRASLPGHLLDRAGNRVVVTGDTTLTLPAAVPGYARDFLVRLEVSGSRQVSFSPSSGVAYTGYGNPSGIYSAGTHLLRFTETAEGEFCVTDMLAEYADASALPYALVSKTPVNGVVTLVDRALNRVEPTVTDGEPVWTWSDGLAHGTPAYLYTGNGYMWGFDDGDGGYSYYDAFGNYFEWDWSGDADSEEVSFSYYDEGEGTYVTVTATKETPYVSDVTALALPGQVSGKVRDFMVRLVVPENMPTLAWPANVAYETEDGNMPDVSEPGVYLLAFTETGAGRFALMCRKVQEVE